MRILRGLLGALLWIVAALLGLVGLVLCVTVILLPLGIPLLGVARRLLTRSVQLMLPASLAHPTNEASKVVRKKGHAAEAATESTVGAIGKKTRKFAHEQRRSLA
ncbi:hypothetical protein ABGB19_17225 [Mycobacterium sp. B14F4]|uniref:hypothetical protein n=1 Tax=Mycobacterium sp. B14F4 TaxID=3153565 RepID=UPI00325CE7F1